MGGNKYGWRGEFHPTIQGTGTTYYSSGWIGVKAPSTGFAIGGTLITALPSIGHFQTVVGFPTGHISTVAQSGNYWFSIDTRDNVVIYQSPATDSGGTMIVKPNIWYPAASKFVCHSKVVDTRFIFDGVITDV